MLEVLVAILLAMIGLMGTLAVQQTVLSATANSNDAQVALRLATRALEEFNARRTSAGPPIVDLLAPIAGSEWSPPVYLDASGQAQASPSGRNRWMLQTLVTDTGFARPYNLSVVVVYALDTGAPKSVRLDAERRKTW
jgi:type II secretory pathway pseudopilin PulG